MKLKKVDSISNYLKAVENICKDWGTLGSTTLPWFRGQSDSKWNLVPSLYRDRINKDYEREINRDFKLRASAYLDFVPQNTLEWLFIMQHFGLPTRLLDWTESSLVALYFAVCDCHLKRDAAIWILEPWSLNIATINIQTVPTADSPLIRNHILEDNLIRVHRKVDASFPIAIRPVRNTQRIIMQKGTFTLHGKEDIGLEEIFKQNSKIKLQKIVIDGHKRKVMLKQLYMAGISDSLLYPDLDGLVQDITYRYSKDFLNGLGFEMKDRRSALLKPQSLVSDYLDRYKTEYYAPVVVQEFRDALIKIKKQGRKPGGKHKIV